MSNKNVKTASYYGWVPSITGWLSFRSCRQYFFKGFGASCDYTAVEADQRKSKFIAFCGKNLNDSSVSLASLEQQLLFSISAKRRSGLSDEGGKREDDLRGWIDVYLPKTHWSFFKLRYLSLTGSALQRLKEKSLAQRDDVEFVARVVFSMDRVGSCVLKLSRRSKLEAKDFAKEGDGGWLVAQAFIVLKDYFHTHVAHSISTDSGVPLVAYSSDMSVSDIKMRIETKMTRRFHRKYASLIEVDAYKAKIYLTFLKIFLSVVGNNSKDKKYLINKNTCIGESLNPLHEFDTYSVAREILNDIHVEKSSVTGEYKTLIFGMIATVFSGLALYFQVFGQIDDKINLITFREMMEWNNRSMYSLFIFSSVIFVIYAALPTRRVMSRLDSTLSFLFGTYVFANLQNLAMPIKANYRFPFRSSYFYYLFSGVVLFLAIFLLKFSLIN